MIPKKKTVPLFVLISGFLVAACASGPAKPFEDQLREQLIAAEPEDVIEIPAGVHAFTRSLTLNADGVTIRGAGMDQSILSFKEQIAGAEGLIVNASDFVIEDLAIEDTKGDALKVNEGDNIVIRRLRTEWTGGPSVDNGSYGIYPVQTTNVLIEGAVAIGASDAGIYVGQSQQVIVRDSRAEYNVAGIEIENTVGADVYDNVARHNTGGILVFNMPDLELLGHSTRVFDNDVSENNTANFAPAGTAVAGVPAGSGIIVNSNDRVEIFRNQIRDNQTANILVSSYFSVGYDSSNRKEASTFDPYPETIYIYENDFEGGGEQPGRHYLESYVAEGGVVPDVVWDGAVNPEMSWDDGAICVQGEGVEVLNVDQPNQYAAPKIERSPYDCHHDKLPQIELPVT